VLQALLHSAAFAGLSGTLVTVPLTLTDYEFTRPQRCRSIALFGIAARNGILLVSHIRHLKEEEGVAGRRDAVVRGAVERLAPILMTALMASLALLPLALGTGKPGSEIQAAMALVILYGLLNSTFLNMVVLPAIYYRFRRF
jgi:Cu/Ag efflux pump CusA